jgi:Cu(I)/Ag(I) efflux system membrane fusion protein
MRIKILNLIVTTGALTLLGVSGLMCQKTQSANSGAAQTDAVTTDTNYNKTGTATEYYTCSMHPQVHQAKPGQCPICGMNLEFHKAE